MATGFKRAGGLTLALLVGSVLAACAAGHRPANPAQARDNPIPVSGDAITASNVGHLAERRRITASVGPLLAVSFAPGSHELASVGTDHVVRQWNGNSGRFLGELYEHRRSGLGLAYSPDGSRLLSAGGAVGQDIVLLDLETGSVLASTSTDGYYTAGVSWSVDGATYVVVSRGSSRIYIFNADGSPLRQSRVGGIPLEAAAHTENYMAVVSTFGTTYVYEYAAGGLYDYLREMRYEGGAPGRAVTFSPDGKLLATCYLDGKVDIRQTVDWALARSFQAHRYVEDAIDGCLDGAFAPGSDVYFSAGGDGDLAAWDPQTGEELWRAPFGVPVRAVSLSTDGELAAAALADGTLRILAPSPAEEAAGP